ncbi:ribonucleoside-diphosphate reductase subunit alpha [Salmonella enterica subsp. enterica serovar Saintpaul]|uniref:class 1a ribonucleoside-diphosphate reductase subunit alpha n=1 Tax=Salmonella enterica TaxID=28901 RepID=UPI0011BD72A6|nr:class 1a ribonucleoside-diphosphate reductase subunit alpha [Salmonella enterica]HEC8958862.1 ribonucleoside-diphosphate reductase subunit alpha [Salmonella enterica subsp. enterica serovar Muenchen]EHI5013628.1 ribonucleoside-diphosphate reductase subunit alpha [Salmonella enterica]EHJ2180787.1 ribonucleoside-diphosphate reductase subunit alpha [Salmonella enterica]MDJ4432750.1 ribonucleoside-diphosphate reductase subunit alpha [Salmonella enterica]MDJ4978039.1 ribonucleoside-diphosphate r
MISIVKRDGSIEPLSEEKYNRVVMWGVENIRNVSASAIAMGAAASIFDGMTTCQLHEALVKSAADLISPETPNYSKVAARLNLFKLRKDAFGQYEYPNFYNHIVSNVSRGVYDEDILKFYSPEEIVELGVYIKPKRDEYFGYAATVQLASKYLVQNRVTGEIYEGPQQLYMLVGMCLFQNWEDGCAGKTRLEMVKGFYDVTSSFKLSLPTPIMAGVRTPTRQFSSCVLIEAEDSLKGISAASSVIIDYVSRRAGIGVGFGRLRALGSEIRNGEATHTGVIPFLKHFQTAVKSCSQGGVRGGAATAFYPIWHLEVESLLVLKNNRGIEENRVRHLDYGVMINRLMYRRLVRNENITLFSPHDVPDLYDAFFVNQDKFEELYLKYEADESIRKKSIQAVDLFSTLMQERASTGRVYIANVDHMNNHGAFVPEFAPVHQSNLCMEITLPTKPLEFTDDPNGEIALCTLSAFNLGAIRTLDSLKDVAFYAVAALDSLLDYQDYPMDAAEIPAKARRSLGIGVTNFAYYLAKNGFNYSGAAGNQLVHETFEAIQYYLLDASCRLAEAKGACDWFSHTKYAQGKLPVDHYRKTLDANPETSFELKMPWEELRGRICAHGLRNSTLTAQMPCETSSQITNSTNGIEPPRGPVSVKSSKDGIVKMVVPDFAQLKDQYEYLWDMPDNRGYLTKVAIIQKFFDQAISANTNYDPTRFPDDKVPMMKLLEDLLFAYQKGVKTLYYHNTRDGAGKREDDLASFSAADVVEPEDECDGACKI